MKLTEHEGKKLLHTCGIPVPTGVLIFEADSIPHLKTSVLKAQVRSGDRFKHGGILFATDEDSKEKATELFSRTIQGEVVTQILIEERINAIAEYYVSFSYSGDARGPVLSLSPRGGTGVDDAHITPVSILTGLTASLAQSALTEAGFPSEDTAGVSELLLKLWKLFLDESALIAEINPLFKTASSFIAGDAKIVIDDDKTGASERRIISMDGDIAIMASGGGASMLNIDALIRAGGKPANYTEYSGNPPAEVVKELTLKVLSREGLKGCWVVGAFANFTDIYVTLSGFLEGLRELDPKPTYPIVIRRDGPRRDEAFALLEQAKSEGFDLHLYGSDTSMDESANIMAKLAAEYI